MRTSVILSRAVQQGPDKLAAQMSPALRRLHEVNPILGLQRKVGNQATQHMLREHAEGRRALLPATNSPHLNSPRARISERPVGAGVLQTKLTINQPGDAYEQEADRVAAQVMRMPEPKLQRACACGGECPHCKASQTGGAGERLQTKPVQGGTGSVAAPPSVHEVLRSAGRPLSAQTRAYMEPRFGHDFSQVRAHYDPGAAESARQVNARAYTVGNNIVFGSGEYAPGTREGLGLIAHELTHVIQQGGGECTTGASGVMQRQYMGGEEPMPEIPDPRDPAIKSAPKGKSWTGASKKCGKDFCRPWPTQRMAEDDRKTLWPIFMAGILVKVSRRVIPLWSSWAFGGSTSVQDITKDFGGDFTSSKSTAKTTRFLEGEIKSKLTSSPPAVPVGGSVKLDIATLIPAAIKAIDTPGDTNEMNFNAIGEIPGNIAGGIGKNQKANPVGANPSPQDDERLVAGDVTVMNPGGGDLLAMPNLNYTVKDTIDLCPGDCGAKKEQIATIPMSRWEATGISGDFPFKVDFPGLAVPFRVPAAAKPAPAPPAPAPGPSPSPAP